MLELLVWLLDHLPESRWFHLIGGFFSPVVNIVQYFGHRADRKKLIVTAREAERRSIEATAAQVAAAKMRSQLDIKQGEVSSREARVAKLEGDIQKITEGSATLWKLRPARPFPEYKNWLRDPRGAKILTVGNLKGGVGKTTIAANLAAYISETRQQPVLLVDLDFQGSLTNMVLTAVEKDEGGRRVDALFDETAEFSTVVHSSIQLVPKMQQAWLVPTTYEFTQFENKLLYQTILDHDGTIDVRYRLAHALLRPEVRQNYVAIILDMPPRMSMGALNALIASHQLLVPSLLDTLSVEAVEQFLRLMADLKREMELDLELAGVLANKTRNDSHFARNEDGELINLDPAGSNPLVTKEANSIKRLAEYVSIWPGGSGTVVERTLQQRAAFQNDVGYVQGNVTDRNIVRQAFDPVAALICDRLKI